MRSLWACAGSDERWEDNHNRLQPDGRESSNIEGSLFAGGFPNKFVWGKEKVVQK